MREYAFCLPYYLEKVLLFSSDHNVAHFDRLRHQVAVAIRHNESYFISNLSDRLSLVPFQIELTQKCPIIGVQCQKILETNGTTEKIK